ncbi:MAG: acetate--CoA ligase family protein, partial [Flavobacteriaceae bacterium]|nr:acetate--CoA ligase family protein [Flavobacteriaceae bacterium]
ILPSVVNVKDEISEFISHKNIAFNDEVLFGHALAKVFNTPKNQPHKNISKRADIEGVKKIIHTSDNGYLNPKNANSILTLAGIDFVDEFEVGSEDQLIQVSQKITYPVVQKVVGPLHKSDSGGVILNVKNKQELLSNFRKLMQIKDATSVLIQPMISGKELFIGAKREIPFAPIIMCGLGGIFVEVLKDVSIGMVPVSKTDAAEMIKSLKAYPILEGIRGQKGIDLKKFEALICKISHLMETVPEIAELDINPLLASADDIKAVDVRIRIEK